uniref:Uncharacterized protein n=1 Tax=Clastoptera arizonana TaxID=38151 RepID=A0A1B6C3M7_9HEMI
MGGENIGSFLKSSYNYVKNQWYFDWASVFQNFQQPIGPNLDKNINSLTFKSTSGDYNFTVPHLLDIKENPYYIYENKSNINLSGNFEVFDYKDNNITQEVTETPQLRGKSFLGLKSSLHISNRGIGSNTNAEVEVIIPELNNCNFTQSVTENPLFVQPDTIKLKEIQGSSGDTSESIILDNNILSTKNEKSDITELTEKQAVNHKSQNYKKELACKSVSNQKGKVHLDSSQVKTLYTSKITSIGTKPLVDEIYNMYNPFRRNPPPPCPSPSPPTQVRDKKN